MAAMTTDRVGRTSGEAFNRLRSDHEQFLEAYEKPTQIYRFLKARHSLRPLFLHRNLSYLRRRNSCKRRKRLKKFRVDDLLKHTREEKPDLATEIKSDNYLQISFSGLEKGIDFEQLLEAAVDSKLSSENSTNESEEATNKHENHQLEVEVMLYRFKQPVAETLIEAPRVCPYNYSSLGKFLLNYRHDKKTNGRVLNNRDNPNRNLTLSIPESELTWKGGSKSSGTQMLVFRACQSTGAEPDTSKEAISHAPSFTSSCSVPTSAQFSTKKVPARKTVALELNRINPSNLGKVQSQGGGGALTTSAAPGHNQDQTGNHDSSNLKGKTKVAVVDSQLLRNCSKPSLENLSAKKINGHGLTASSNKKNWSDCNHKQHAATFEDTDFSETDSDQNYGPSTTLSSSSAAKKRPETKEIGVVTDLCGIDSILDLSPASSKASGIPSTVPAATNGSRKGSANLRLSLPTPSLKKGCTDRCTSPGFPSKQQTFTNGARFNGFTFNGYANPEVLKLRAGPEVYQQKKKKKKAAVSVLQKHSNQQIKSLLSSDSNGRLNNTLTHKDPETGEIRPLGELQVTPGLSGDGKSGEVPFTVSIPRTILSSSVSNESDSDSMEYLDAEEGSPAVREEDDATQVFSGVEKEKGGANRNVSTQQKTPSSSSSSTYKRRSEIQLLLDGDKPPSERISASEVPIFTAEDVSSRNTRSTGGGGGAGGGASNGGSGQLTKPWLDSSTRKITPVEHFDYSYLTLTQKFTGMINSSASSGGGGVGCTNSSGVGSAANVTNNRKRNISDSDSVLSAASSSLAVPPPSKQQKVNNNNINGGSAVVVEEKCSPRFERGGTVSSERSGVSVSPAPERERGDVYNDQVSDSRMAVDNVSYGGGSGKLDTEFSRKSGTDDKKGSIFQADDVFASELVVFDSRGDCLLKEGEYSIIMQKCSKKTAASGKASRELLTFPPLTWNSVFGGSTDSKKLEDSNSANIMLRFSLCWTDGPPQHRLCSEFETALDFKKIREAYFSPRSPSPPPVLPAPSLPPSMPRPQNDPSNDADAISLSSSMSELDRMSDTPLPQAPPTNASKARIQEFVNDLEEVETEEPISMETVDLVSYSLHPHAPPPLPGGTSTTPGASLPVSCVQEKLVFNFLYNNNTLQQTESHGEMRCPWCHLHCERLYSLLKHMSLSHPRFHYTYTPRDSGPSVIDVHVNKMYDTGPSVSERDPGERSDISFLQRKRGPTKRIPFTALLVERHADIDEDLSEFLNDGSWKRGYITNRIYHHSRSSLPMLPQELENESEEDEKSLEWQIISSQKMIDEFTDVNKGEKELMKLWNHFAMQNKLIASKQIPSACLNFAKEKKQELIEKGIVQNFMTHLITLCDIGLITPTSLRDSMACIYTDITS